MDATQITYPIRDMQVFLEHILNLNLNIKNKIFTSTKFEDPSVEDKYQKSDKSNKNINFFGDFILILGNIFSLVYILVFLDFTELRVLFILNLILSIFFFAIQFYKDFKKYSKIFDHINVFIMTLTYHLKIIFILYLYQDKLTKEQITGEILRIIIYQFVLTSLIILLKFEASFTIYTFYFLSNLSMIILIIINQNSKFQYFFEAVVSFANFYITFSFRKYFEYHSRSNFAMKYKVEGLSNYAFKFMKGLENNHIVLKQEKIVFINENFSNYLDGEVLNSNNFNNNDSVNNNTDVNISTLNLNQRNNYLLIFKDLIKIDENKFCNPNDSENINEESLLDILMSMKNKNFNSNKFINLGTFNFKTINNNKFFNILIRPYKCAENGSFQDLIFFDVSNLLSMRKQIHEANLVKERVMAKLAHELKTPMNSIIGMIDIIAEKNISPRKNNINNEKTKEMKCITGLSYYTINLVNDIIQFSSNNQNASLNKECTSLIEVLNFNYEVLEALLYTKNSTSNLVKPIFDVNEMIIYGVKIFTDHIRLKQILLNLISNAVKFCKNGNVTLKCRYLEELNKVRITVSDTGIGIKEEDLEKLFNDFVMLEDKDNLNRQGSGLGLSICKNLSNLLDLELEFKSVYGKGTEISLDIPILQIDDIEDDIFTKLSIRSGQIPAISNFLKF